MDTRKDTEREIVRRSEERHRLLLDILPHGVQENDCAGVITYSNRAHHRILGYEAGELLGKNIWDQQPSAADRESLRDHLAYLVESQPPPAPFLTRNRRKDGSLIDLQIDWDYERDTDGTLKGFISVITDVTHRTEVEESLRRRTEGLAALLDVSKRFAATFDLQTVLQATVDGLTGLVGLDTAVVYLLENELLTLWATTPPLPPEFPNELRIARLRDHPLIRKALESRAPLLVSDFAEEKLSRAERSAAEQRDLRTVLFLPLIAEMEVLGVLAVGSTGSPSPIPQEEIALSRTLANLAALTVRNAQLYNDGQRYAAQLEQTLADRRRAETEREHLRMQLSQAQKMESIGRLAGGVAHDFNNMLSIILGHAELGLTEVDPSERIYEGLQEIRAAAERSANLTQQLLAFARKQTVAPRLLDLNETIESMLKMLRRLISENVALEWIPDHNLWPVRLDPAQIDQMLANLCINARDAIAGEGKVVIETRNAFCDKAFSDTRPGFVPGEYVTLAVSDNGCGMDADTREKIFEPFFTTKGIGKGTGLGLATVYGIVKQNNGFIDVDSGPGKGTRFTVYLPRHAGEPGLDLDEKTFHTTEQHRGNLLLVEDEPALLEIARTMLEMQGYTVLAAATPTEALRRAVEHTERIDLLVTDVVMPEMNGRVLARRLQAVYPDLKCLFISGYTSDVIFRHGVLEEGVHFLQKPFTVERLAEKVRQTLAS